ncbi:D-sedoheptulose-7-phosphate isomerase [Prochlorococcus marinus]|uniref:D-sedoheptulose-7-phosphate isomerase n=1 Tax=Prochlorococcus marinus TaxID=1219 RepID=UPI0022B3B28F|nr:SIS domain-containing protein [Prochlorococcus marinus]
MNCSLFLNKVKYMSDTNKDELLSSLISNHIDLIEDNKEHFIEKTKEIANYLTESLNSGGTIFWCGNGGSAADCQHLAADLVCRFISDREPLRSISLTTDTSILTAISNDYSFNDVFSRQLKALGKKGDVLIAISTSGNSPNILKAIETAKSMNIKTIGLLGNDKGKAAKIIQTKIIVPSKRTARIQEIHILIGHLIIQLVELNLAL